MGPDTQLQHPPHPRWLAAIPALAFAHVLWTYLPSEWAGVLWVCNLCAGLLAVGVLVRSALLVWVAVLWIVVGTPLWLLDGAMTGSWTAHSPGVHLVCPVVGWFALRGRAPPAGRLWVALGLMLGLQGVCLLFTPASMNVNLAFGSAGWADVPFAVHWGGMAVVLTGALVLADRALVRVISMGAPGRG